MGFSRQEYWSGLSFPSPGDLPDPGIEPKSPALAGGFFTAEPPYTHTHTHTHTHTQHMNIHITYMYTHMRYVHTTIYLIAA